jgi:pyruvate/2-oxoacid:ferredoxin oxidoreductase alpha subunit
LYCVTSGHPSINQRDAEAIRFKDAKSGTCRFAEEGRLRMSSSISKVCDQLVEIKDQFEENEELVEAITGSDNAEDLLIAIGMAIAYTEGAITLNKKGESHLKASLEEISQIAEEFGDIDEEDDDE